MTNAQFNEKDEIAKTDLFFILKNKIFFNVQTMNTIAKALWESLHKVYEDKSLVNNIFLRKKFYNLGMKDEVSILEYLNEFNSIVNELLGICVKVDEEEHASLLL